MAVNFEWTCAYCDRVQTASDPNHHETFTYLAIGVPAEGELGMTCEALRCLNDACKKTSITVQVSGVRYPTGYALPDLSQILFHERIVPRGASMPQPEYIPAAIREDYQEACLILDLSPKASATLSRRCLQGMIRDFAGIARGTLDAEIRALQAAVQEGTAPRSISDESVAAIDHVRRIGNIGAHMEKDINIVIEVEAGEARALTDLVELLLREWYVDRHNRQQRLASVAAIRAAKDEAKQAGTPNPFQAPVIGNSS